MVAEMIRVVKRAIFLSDSNRFGQGSRAARLLKTALYKTGLWRTARFVQTKGKMYTLSEGDGSNTRIAFLTPTISWLHGRSRSGYFLHLVILEPQRLAPPVAHLHACAVVRFQRDTG